MLFFRGPSRKQTETLREVLERMEEIERGFKRMRLEWEDAFDKLQGVAQRVAKRAEICGRQRDPPWRVQSSAHRNEMANKVAVGIEHVDEPQTRSAGVVPADSAR